MAIDLYTQAAQHESTIVHLAHDNLGVLLQNVRKDFDGAEAAYRAAIAADPEHAMAHNNLGYLLLTIGTDLEGAEAAYTAALTIDASHALAGPGQLYARAALTEQCGEGLAAVATQYEAAAEGWGNALGAEHEAAQMARAAAARVRRAATLMVTPASVRAGGAGGGGGGSGSGTRKAKGKGKKGRNGRK